MNLNPVVQITGLGTNHVGFLGNMEVTMQQDPQIREDEPGQHSLLGESREPPLVWLGAKASAGVMPITQPEKSGAETAPF